MSNTILVALAAIMSFLGVAGAISMEIEARRRAERKERRQQKHQQLVCQAQRRQVIWVTLPKESKNTQSTENSQTSAEDQPKPQVESQAQNLQIPAEANKTEPQTPSLQAPVELCSEEERERKAEQRRKEEREAEIILLSKLLPEATDEQLPTIATEINHLAHFIPNLWCDLAGNKKDLRFNIGPDGSISVGSLTLCGRTAN